MERVEYELFYLVGESKEAELPKIREEVEAIVKGVGGEFLSAETSEKRSTAYEIGKERRGTYVARRFTLPGQSDEPFVEEVEPAEHAIPAMTRALRLYPSVLRFLILRANELPELKPIPREERPKPVRRDDRRRQVTDRRPSKPIVGEEWKAEEPAEKKEEKEKEEKKQAPKAEKPAEKKVDTEEMDKQLKEALDI